MSTIQIRDIVCEPGQKTSGFVDVADTPSSKIRIPVMVAKGVRPGPTICLVGGTHSTEYHGIVSVIRFMQQLDLTQLSGAVVAVPVLNLPGFEVIEAYNPIDGLQILEACPGTLEGSMTHRITYTFFREVVSHVDYLIDFHGGTALDHMENIILYRTGNQQIDKASEEMSRHFLLEYVSLRNASKTGAGVVDRAMLLGKPAILVEVGNYRRIQEELIELNLRGTRNVLRYLKILDGNIETPSEQKGMRKIVRLICNRGGIFLSLKNPADLIKKGETIGRVSNLFGEVVEEIIAPFDGIVYTVNHLPPVYTGDITFMVGSFDGEPSYTSSGYAGYRKTTYVLPKPK